VKDSVDDVIGSVTLRSPASSPQEQQVKAEDISDDVITFVNKLLAEAFLKKASDIHVEPYEKTFRSSLSS
jgi:type IV pilus assembly protein PilB